MSVSLEICLCPDRHHLTDGPRCIDSEEVEILVQLSQGANLRTISVDLHCSRRTVQRRVDELKARLHVGTTNELIFAFGLAVAHHDNLNGAPTTKNRLAQK